MALTLRTNGSGSTNLVGAAWWNDYYNLLTGAMADQEVTINNNLVLKGLGAPPSTGVVTALVSGTGLGVGLYDYLMTFVSPDGESLANTTPTAITTTTGNQQVSVSSIDVGPTGTTARNLYRTKVGGGATYYLLHTIADNTTTTYTDSTADASLGTAHPPTVNTFGGSLVIKDYLGNVKLTITNDGTITSGSGSLGNTTITGTLTVSGIITGSAGYIGNGKFGKATPGDVIDASGSDTVIKLTGATNMFHFSSNGADVATIDYHGGLWLGAGININGTVTYQNGNSLSRVAQVTGTGSATYTHGLGATPSFCVPQTNVAGSTGTNSYDSPGSTTVHVTQFNTLFMNIMTWR